jgi:sarcosine oxidase subunit gamma
MSDVTVTDAASRGMVTLRGALDVVGDVASRVAGVALPMSLRGSFDGDGGLLWMAPDELLLLTAPGGAPAAVAALDAALAGIFHTAVDVSDARAGFIVDGPRWREVLAKLTPADVSPAAFGAGTVRRSRLGQVAAAFWTVDGHAAHVLCSRSVAPYMRDQLTDAARAGTEVAYW